MPELDNKNMFTDSFNRLFFSCLFCCNERIVIIIWQTDRDVSREREADTRNRHGAHTLTPRTHWFSAHPPPPWLHLNNTVITRCIKFSTEIRSDLYLQHRPSYEDIKMMPGLIKIPRRGKLARGFGEATQQTPPEMIQHPALDHLHRASCQPLKDPEPPEDLSQNKTPGDPMMTSVSQWRTISSRWGWS